MTEDYIEDQDDDQAFVPLEPFPKQHRAIELLLDPKGPNQVCLGGAIRFGKSWAAIMLMFSLCHQHAGITGVVVRKTYTALDTWFIPDVYAVFHGLWGQRAEPTFEYVGGNVGEIRFRNGSTVHLIGADTGKDQSLFKLHGSNLSFGLIEEAQEISDFEQVLGKVTQRLTQAGKFGLKPMVMVTCNPIRDHDLWRLFYEPSKKGTLPEFRAFIQGYTSDNTTLSAEWHQLQQASQTEAEYQINYLGNWEWVSSSSDLVRPEALKAMFREPTDTYGERSFITIDPATDHGSDHTCICVWRDWHLHTVIRIQGVDDVWIEEKVKALQHSFSVSVDHTIIDAGGIGYAVGKRLGWHSFEAGTRALKGEPYVNLKAQMYFGLADKINKGVCTVGVTDTELQGMMSAEILAHKAVNPYNDAKNRVTKKDEVKLKLKRSPDISDAMSYRQWFDYFDDGFDVGFF